MKLRNIGRYQVKAELGKGGMAVVYLATDPRFGRDVAIKVLPRTFQDQSDARARFQREARVIAALEHPAIVPVYDFGEEDGQPYLVMRHMSGGSLADLLTYGRLNMSDAARITERIAGALDEAHGRGIIHRDLKPGNILFDSHGDSFLTDFGIVKLYEGDANQQSMTGSVVLGTPAYMSPEQALGKPIDGRSDVYALGAVLYEMLTGLPPYKGPTSVSVAMKHVLEPVPNPREYRPDLAASIVDVVEHGMAKEPDARFQSAGELATALTAATRNAAGSEPMVPPITVRKKPRTTSTAAQSQAESDVPRGTTQFGDDAGQLQAVATNEGEPRRERNIGLLVALGIAAVALTIAGILLAMSLPRLQGGGTPQTAVRPSTTAVQASSVLVPTRVIVAPTPPQPPTAVPTIPAPPTAVEATAAPAAPTETPVAKLRVIGGGGNVRSGPGSEYSILGQFPAGAEIMPVAYAVSTGNTPGKWFEVVLPAPDGRHVWIHASVVTLINPDLVNTLPLAQNVPPSPPPTSTPKPTITPTWTPVPTLAFTSTPTVTMTPSATIAPTAVPLPTFAVTPTPTHAPLPTVTITGTVAP